MYVQAYIVCCKIINSILPLSPGFLSIVCEVLTFDEAGFTFPSLGFTGCVCKMLTDPNERMCMQVSIVCCERLTLSCLGLQDSCQPPATW